MKPNDNLTERTMNASGAAAGSLRVVRDTVRVVRVRSGMRTGQIVSGGGATNYDGIVVKLSAP